MAVSVSMKLLVNTQAKRVLFAEASKDCVDFLFYMLSLPVATVINLLGKKEMVGSMANLYESIETLNESYIQPYQNKDTLLRPVPQVSGFSVPLLSIADAPSSKKFYRCSCNHKYVSDGPRAACLSCHGVMTTSMTYVAPPTQQVTGSEGGFVKGVVTYMVMDDLVVGPMSAISSIALLNKFNVKEVGALEEKVVKLGMDEAVKLLKASLETNKVLTHVFLNGKK